MRSKTLRVVLSSDCVILSKAKDLICNKDQSLKGVMLYENQLEILGPGGPHPGHPDLRGGCAGVYIGTGAMVLGDVNWLAALSAGGFGFVTAMLLALTGLPEENLSKS